MAAKIVYDIQENYARNIRFSGAYPRILSSPLAGLVRLTELLAAKFTNGMILAEHVYVSQLTFLQQPHIVLENLASNAIKPHSKSTEKRDQVRLLYCGTIAPHYGVFDAIAFANWLSSVDKSVTLLIVGHTTLKSTERTIQQLTENQSNISLQVSSEPLAHDIIVDAMQKADFCLLPYQNNKATEGRIPTKLYECLAMELPVIIQHNPSWNDLINQNNAGMIIDFNNFEGLNIRGLKKPFYGNNSFGRYQWQQNEQALAEFISDLS